MKNKNILVIVTGSIAAYKACEVIRLLRKEGAEVQVMMTKSAQKFVGKTTNIVCFSLKISSSFFYIWLLEKIK